MIYVVDAECPQIVFRLTLDVKSGGIRMDVSMEKITAFDWPLLFAIVWNIRKFYWKNDEKNPIFTPFCRGNVDNIRSFTKSY